MNNDEVTVLYAESTNRINEGSEPLIFSLETGEIEEYHGTIPLVKFLTTQKEQKWAALVDNWYPIFDDSGFYQGYHTSDPRQWFLRQGMAGRLVNVLGRAMFAANEIQGNRNKREKYNLTRKLI